MLLSIDTTIDMYGFFFRRDSYDWLRIAEIIGQAFRVRPDSLHAGGMKQTNTMLQFALSSDQIDPVMPNTVQNCFRTKVYNKFHAKMI